MSDLLAGFDGKVSELVAVCRPLDIPRVLMVRRMTLNDPQTLRWATVRQIETIFTVVLTEKLKCVPTKDLDAAAINQFESLLPPDAGEAHDKDRWLLYDLCRPLLSGTNPTVEDSAPSPEEETPKGDEDDEPLEFSTFAALFDATIIRVLRRSMKVLAVQTSRDHVAPPFYLAPAFMGCLTDIAQRKVLPAVRASRMIKELSTSRNWAKNGENILIAMIQSGDARDNPILRQWDERWQALKLGAPVPAKKKPLKAEDLPWPTFAADGGKNEYMPPMETDIWVLQKMLRWDSEYLNEGFREIVQFYNQEFHPANKNDKAREGAFRDCLVKWIEKLPSHAGEALVAKAFFELPRCDKMLLRKVIQTFGMERDRRTYIPLLMDFVESLPK